ncbi:MAG TPA: hypothetical protein VLT17_04945 [Gemmatimonadales bacterium]|jgi:hypothetical protein|nr:hypothetical protein [Gemmatimonadales bacterium]
MTRSLQLIALLTLLAVGVAAQTPSSSPDRWQLTMDDGSYAWDIALVRLDGDQLVFRQADTLGRAPVAKISEVRRIAKTEVRMGEGAGGGAMNALTGGDDEVFDMAAMDYEARLRTVQQILLMHPPKDAQP